MLELKVDASILLLAVACAALVSLIVRRFLAHRTAGQDAAREAVVAEVLAKMDSPPSDAIRPAFAFAKIEQYTRRS